ncbi:MAG TPA: AAA domain-containing protein, partial [Sedimentisphaerales bacterium]|nr:AAA domain-containing protein [Sedimentisphaerales bacterium]
MIVAANENNERLGGQVFRNYYRLFPKVAAQLPCWAVTSLAISSKVPFEPCFFDLVVIDEASQCDIASALPLLYRAKQAVIIGDPMQLRHISQLTRQQDINLLSKHELAEGFAKWAYGSNSIFDLARSLCSSNDIVNLKDHHRSHKDIIEFSNQNFYRSSLRIATKYDRLKSIKGSESVRWINCCGHVHRPAGGGAVNEIEATAVVQELRRLLLEQNYQGTVGVVTPFRAQANRINDIVTSDRMLLSVLGTQEFLVDTAHGFQGDERDLMIFSPVVSEDTPDTAMGFLRNNPHLFNVAITRARACLVIVGDAGKARVSNVDYLAKFANYVSSVHDYSPTVSSSDFVATPDYPVVSNPEQVSDWERFFYKKMYNAGIIAIPQYQEDQYRLDFALLRNNKKLNIEIDGEMYHRNWDGELCRRDQLRNQRLIELGWDIMRFWVYQIRDNTDWCINRIQQWLDKN